MVTAVAIRAYNVLGLLRHIVNPRRTSEAANKVEF